MRLRWGVTRAGDQRAVTSVVKMGCHRPGPARSPARTTRCRSSGSRRSRAVGDRMNLQPSLVLPMMLPARPPVQMLACPPYPQKQTSQKRESMSASGHNETLAAQAFGGNSNSSGQLRHDLCDMFALVARAIKTS